MENDIICQPGRRLSTALSLSANWNWCIYKPNLTQCIRLQSANVAVSRCQSAVSGRDERADRDRKLHQWRDGGGVCARGETFISARWICMNRARGFIYEGGGGRVKSKTCRLSNGASTAVNWCTTAVCVRAHTAQSRPTLSPYSAVSPFANAFIAMHTKHKNCWELKSLLLYSGV